MNWRFPALLLGLCISGLACADGRLTVHLDGIQHDGGSVRIALYADAKSFRKPTGAYAAQQAPATPGTVDFVFDDLPAGRYAVMAYHDEDGNGKLNLRFGMFPTEGYGLSNNPAVKGPPSFEDSAFEVVDGEQAINIDIRY